METLIAAGGAFAAFLFLFFALWVLRRPERRTRRPGGCARCTCGGGDSPAGEAPRCREAGGR
ncbi:MAG: hypothetical protein WHT06_06290 [Desulfobacterales bacterium]